MDADRLLADVEGLADRAVGLALGHEAQDLELARGEADALGGAVAVGRGHGRGAAVQRQPRPRGQRLELGGERAGAQPIRRRRGRPPARPGRRRAHRRRRGSPRPGASARRRSHRARRTRPSARRRRATPRPRRCPTARACSACVVAAFSSDSGGQRPAGNASGRTRWRARSTSVVGERAGLALGLRVAGGAGGDGEVGGGPRADREDGREVEGVLVRRLDAVEHGDDGVARFVRAPAPERELGRA